MRPARLAPLVLALLPALAWGQTITVPAEAATIQAAVDLATPGTEILIKGGVYVENVVVDGHTDVALRAKGKVIIRPALGVGVTVSNSTGILLEKLRVEGSGSHGFHVIASSDVTISKARVTDAGGDSIRTDGGSDITIERCKIEGGGDAIALSAAGATPTNVSVVSRNKIMNPLGDGVIVNGNTNLIERNVAFEVGDDGFQVDFEGAGTGNKFLRNKIVRAASNGLLSFDTDNTFQDNVVLFPEGAGIYAVGTMNLFEDNRIVRPQSDGVLVQADNSTFRRNKVTRPGADGVDIESNGSLYDSNKVSKAGDDGFEVSGIGNTIQDNVAKGSFFFDLFDVTDAGQNTYLNNAFKTTFP